MLELVVLLKSKVVVQLAQVLLLGYLVLELVVVSILKIMVILEILLVLVVLFLTGGGCCFQFFGGGIDRVAHKHDKY